MLISYRDQTFKIELLDFAHLTEYIETQLNYELSSMYQIVFKDDDDEICVCEEATLQAAIELCKTKKIELHLIVQNANIEAQTYILKRQISSDQSNIYQDSLFQINQKIQQIKDCQRLNELQQSIYDMKDEEINIPQIMKYYQSQLVKFMDNYEKQSTEHKSKHQEQYFMIYGQLIHRMNMKLIKQFEIIASKNGNVENNEQKQFI